MATVQVGRCIRSRFKIIKTTLCIVTKIVHATDFKFTASSLSSLHLDIKESMYSSSSPTLDFPPLPSFSIIISSLVILYRYCALCSEENVTFKNDMHIMVSIASLPLCQLVQMMYCGYRTGQFTDMHPNIIITAFYCFAWI